MVAMLALMNWCILDTRRRFETPCRHPFTIISEKTSTSSYPGAVRDYVASIMRVLSDATPRRALVRSNVLRTTSTNSPIPLHFYQAISQDLSKAFAEGTYLKDGPPRQGEQSAPPNPLSDPAAMDGMMAGMRAQMVMMVPQMIVMGWINFFFEGFVLSTSHHSPICAYRG
jgi:integral membrane protein DUF106